jgi:hypothetical protein
VLGLENDQVLSLFRHIRERGIHAIRVEWGRPTLVLRDPDGNELFFWIPDSEWANLPPDLLAPGIPKPLGPNVEQQPNITEILMIIGSPRRRYSMGCITNTPGENCRMMLPSNQGESIYCGGKDARTEFIKS